MNQQLTPNQEQELKEILELFKEVEQRAKEGYEKSLQLYRRLEQDVAKSKAR